MSETGPRRRAGWPKRRASLLFQIAALLTVALIPIGTVAIVQTQRAIAAVRETYLDALRAQTLAAATPEREAIVQALGVSRGLSDALAVLDPDEAACRDLMKRSAATNPRALFVGFIEPPGVSRCNNRDQVYDFTGNARRVRCSPTPRGTCASIRAATSPGSPS